MSSSVNANAELSEVLSSGSPELQSELPVLIETLHGDFQSCGDDTAQLCVKIAEPLERIQELCGRSFRSNRVPMIGYGPIYPILTSLLDLSGLASVDVKLTTCQILRNLSVEESGALRICCETALLESLHKTVLDEADASGEEIPDTLREKALSVFFHLSDVDENRESLLRMEQRCTHTNIVDTCCRPLLEKDSYMGTRALMFIAILVGSEENEELLSANPVLIDRIVALLKNILYDEQFSKKYGWKVTHPLYPLRKLCIAEKNKEQLATKDTLMLLVKVLEVYTDHLYARQLAIGTLLELSFLFDEDDDDLQEVFDGELRGALVPQLDKHVEDIPEADHLINKIDVDRRGTSSENLCNFLAVQEVDDADKRHIMMSYSWSAKKDHVIELSNMLRAKGYDVWRDEDGSSCVPPMGGGGVDEIMAMAVEKAAMVIICVSRPYKESANCRMEGQYANRERKAGNTELAFVMMDDTYTTVSESRVDGWLGIMIGDALWYPAWEQTQLQSTCDRISVNVDKLAQSVRLQPTSSKPAKVTGRRSSRRLSRTEEPATVEKPSSGNSNVSVEKPSSGKSFPTAALAEKPSFSKVAHGIRAAANAAAIMKEMSKPSSGSAHEMEGRRPSATSATMSGCSTTTSASVQEVTTSNVVEVEVSAEPKPLRPSRHVHVTRPVAPYVPPSSISFSEEEQDLLMSVDLGQIGPETVLKWLLRRQLQGFCKIFHARQVDGRGLFIMKAMTVRAFTKYAMEQFPVAIGEALSLHWELRATNAAVLFEELIEASADPPCGDIVQSNDNQKPHANSINASKQLEPHYSSLSVGEVNGIHQVDVLELGEQRMLDLAKFVSKFCLEMLQGSELNTEKYKSMENLQRLVELSKTSDDTDTIADIAQQAKPAEQPLQQPVQQPLEQRFQQPLDQSVEQPVQQPLKQRFQQPLDQSVEQHAQQSVQQPVEAHFSRSQSRLEDAKRGVIVSSGETSFDRAWRLHRNGDMEMSKANFKALHASSVESSHRSIETAASSVHERVASNGFGSKYGYIIDQMQRGGWSVMPGHVQQNELRNQGIQIHGQ